MDHAGRIGGREVVSDFDFIVYHPSAGIASEHTEFESAKRRLQWEMAKLKAQNLPCELSIFRWHTDRWSPAVTLYEVEEWELRKNPSRAIHLV